MISLYHHFTKIKNDRKSEILCRTFGQVFNKKGKYKLSKKSSALLKHSSHFFGQTGSQFHIWLMMGEGNALEFE